MKAIILVGGLGTRLRSCFTDLPKPMAPIDNKPFLAYLLDYLQRQGITSIIFSVHYLKEKIQDYFQEKYAGMHIEYATEAEPLGTGGAICHALSNMDSIDPIFALNGDTFVKLDYQMMYDQHIQRQTKMTMALRAVSDCTRYGKVITDTYKALEFNEKGSPGPGYINAGVYLINPTLFAEFKLPKQFSLENNFLFPHLKDLNPDVFIANDYFIDIGLPEDYARARTELALHIK